MEIFNKIQLALILNKYKKLIKLNPEKIKIIQFERLKEICYFAYNNTRFYQNLWVKNKFNPNNLETINDIKKIPLITKADFQSQFPCDFLSRNQNVSDCFLLATSGSTGLPVSILSSKKKSIEELVILSKYFWSIIENEKFHNPVYITDGGEYCFEAQGKKIMKSESDRFIDINEPIDLILKKIIENNYDAIGSYPSVLIQLCNYCIEHEINMKNRIKLIVLSAEAVTDNVRRLIHKVFNCLVREIYVATEAGTICIETKNGLNSIGWKCIVEILDENDEHVKEGEIGNIVVTDLVNFATPLIRYKGLSDIACFDSTESDFGGIKLKKIEGRIADIIYLRNGISINPFKFIKIFESFVDIAQFQLIQTKDKNYTVNLVSHCNVDEFLKLKNELEIKLKELINDGSSIEIVKKSNIARKPGTHKIPLIISNDKGI